MKKHLWSFGVYLSEKADWLRDSQGLIIRRPTSEEASKLLPVAPAGTRPYVARVTPEMR